MSISADQLQQLYRIAQGASNHLGGLYACYAAGRLNPVQGAVPGPGIISIQAFDLQQIALDFINSHPLP